MNGKTTPMAAWWGCENLPFAWSYVSTMQRGSNLKP